MNLMYTFDAAAAACALRAYPIGAEFVSAGTVSFRVWAPQRGHVLAVLHEDGRLRTQALEDEGNGYFSATCADVSERLLYGFRLDDEAMIYPDPASRFQPHGHDGLSQIVDPARFAWTDHAWRGPDPRKSVIYEMHIGTFTREGTWRAAQREIKWLRDLGISVLEIMPVCEFPGRFGWGYDLVHYFAPTRLYGTPDDMRAFVDEAHRLGLAVILDVVYNHCGTNGCFLPAYAASYFSDRHRNEWGHALNFDGAGASAVREYFVTNADYWIREFHLDGFRFDATQQIFDTSPTHILAEIERRARCAARGRSLLLIGENEPQDVHLLGASHDGGCGLDALWNDDFHHSARVAGTGRVEAYYSDYTGSPQELISAAKRGFLYQGQYYSWQKQGRGTPALGLPPSRFVTFLDNHDQVANSTHGRRLHALTSPGRWRALTALLLLAPGVPMLFQGQEFAASSPFVYFADNTGKAAELAREGRREFMRQFPSVRGSGERCLADPADPATLLRCVLDLDERARHAEAVALHRDLLNLRNTDAIFSGEALGGIDGAVIGPEAFLLRYFARDGADRLLLVNLGRHFALTPMSEPLLAAPSGTQWMLMWSSEEPAYGGDGTPTFDAGDVWQVSGHAAFAFAAKPPVCAAV